MDAQIAHNAMHRWHAQIEESPSVMQVLAEVQDFLATLTPAQRESLPDDCRPSSIRGPSDIDEWNVRLAQAARALWNTDGGHEVLVEVGRIFQLASIRISHILSDTSPPPGHN